MQLTNQVSSPSELRKITENCKSIIAENYGELRAMIADEFAAADLLLVKRVGADRHGGEFSIETPNQGSIFHRKMDGFCTVNSDDLRVKTGQAAAAPC